MSPEIWTAGYGFWLLELEDVPWSKVAPAGFEFYKPVLDDFGIHSEEEFTELREQEHMYALFLAHWMSAAVGYLTGYNYGNIGFVRGYDDTYGYGVIFMEKAIWEYSDAEIAVRKDIRKYINAAVAMLTKRSVCSNLIIVTQS
jgi:hypothetical protein